MKIEFIESPIHEPLVIEAINETKDLKPKIKLIFRFKTINHVLTFAP